MGQKLDKAARGAYDAIVYIEGSEVVAEDANGNRITVGSASTVINTMCVRGGSIILQDGNFIPSSTIVVPSGAHLIFSSGACLTPLTDINVLSFLAGSKATDVNINVAGVVGYSKAAIIFEGTSGISTITPVSINGITLVGNYLGVGIHYHVVANETESVYVEGVQITGYCNILRFYDGVLLEIVGTPTVNNWITANTISPIIITYCIRSITELRENSAFSMIIGNSFSNVQIQPTNTSVSGIVLKGTGDCVSGVVWDWSVIGDANAVVIDSMSRGNHIDLAYVLESQITNSSIYDNIIILHRESKIKTHEVAFTDGSILTGSGYNNVIRVSANSQYKTIKSALSVITDATETNRYLLIIQGDIEEESGCVAKSWIDVLGQSAVVNTTDYITIDVANTTWSGLDFYSQNANSVVYIGGTETTRITNCNFRRNHASLRTCVVFMERSLAYVTDCKIEGNVGIVDGDESSVYFSSLASPTIRNSIIKVPDGGITKRGVLSYDMASPRLIDCIIEPPKYVSYYLYNYDETFFGRFRAYGGYAWQLLELEIYVIVGQPGATLQIGTIPGGSDVLAPLDVSVAGNVSSSFVKVQVSAGGYLYASTASGSISQNTIRINYVACKNNTSARSVYIYGKTGIKMKNCIISSAGASDSIYLYNPTGDYNFLNCDISNYNISGNAIRANSTISGEKIQSCVIDGSIINVVGIDGKSSGSSTGTGSEQTIAHGLAAIPTGCKAWIKYLVGTRYITEMVPFDATNIYPTVTSGLAYEWRIE